MERLESIKNRRGENLASRSRSYSSAAQKYIEVYSDSVEQNEEKTLRFETSVCGKFCTRPSGNCLHRLFVEILSPDGSVHRR